MEPDPILEEVWRIKDEIAAEFEYDIHAMFADLVRRQKENEARGVKYATLPPRRVEPAAVPPSPGS